MAHFLKIGCGNIRSLHNIEQSLRITPHTPRALLLALRPGVSASAIAWSPDRLAVRRFLLIPVPSESTPSHKLRPVQIQPGYRCPNLVVSLLGLRIRRSPSRRRDAGGKVQISFLGGCPNLMQESFAAS